jgi:hypothetical protein
MTVQLYRKVNSETVIKDILENTHKSILLYLVDRFFNEDAEGAPIAQ